jgi:hypothetical protein
VTTAPHAKLTWGADCLPESAHYLPKNLPALWPYFTGSNGVKWSPATHTEFPHTDLTWVDQGFDSPGPTAADEYDYERGCWSETGLIGVVRARRARSLPTKIYATWDGYGQLKKDFAELGIGQSVYFRIADWNLSQHLADQELHGDVYAGQWASPTSNPDTLIPGTNVTLATANTDLNVLLTIPTGWVG